MIKDPLKITIKDLDSLVTELSKNNSKSPHQEYIDGFEDGVRQCYPILKKLQNQILRSGHQKKYD